MTESVELHSTYPNKNTKSLIFSQFWWVFRNSRFFFLIHHVVIFARIVYMDVLLPEGNNPGSSSQLQNPAAFQEKTRLFSSGWAQIE